MKSVYILFIIGFISITNAFANGDPVITLSSLNRSANPTPKPIIDVQIIKEELYIKPSLNTTVKVKYILYNSSSKDYDNIDYGFPVDYTGSGMINADFEDDFITESQYTVGWHDYYIKSINFSINGNALSYSMSDETIIERQENKIVRESFMEIGDDFTEEDVENAARASDIARRWFYTKFSIKAGQTCELEVTYTVNNYFSGDLYSLNSLVKKGKGIFNYDMSPAQHWGNGTADELYIELDFADVTNIDNEDSSSLSELGLPFTKKGNKMIYSAKKFNFKNSKPIKLKYLINKKLNYKDFSRHQISPSLYTILVPDELIDYPIKNLSDNDISTAWVTKWKDGETKTLKIVFNKPTIVGAIIVLGGYHKSVDTYKNNAQPQIITIEISPKNEDIKQTLYTLNKDFETQINQYKNITQENILDYSMIYTPFIFSNAYYNPVKEIILNIEDIYPGAKFNDLCISEILILGPNYSPRIKIWDTE